MPSSIPPPNVIPIIDVGASETGGKAIIPSSGNKCISSSPTPTRQTTASSANKTKAFSTPVNHTTVKPKESRISKLSASNQRRSKHNASAKKKTMKQTMGKVMSDQEKKSVELKLKNRERAWITVGMCSVFLLAVLEDPSSGCDRNTNR